MGCVFDYGFICGKNFGDGDNIGIIEIVIKIIE